MSAILVKTVVNTNNSTDTNNTNTMILLLKTIAFTNIFVTILYIVYDIQQR